MFIHRTLTVVFVQVLLSEVDDDVLFPQKVGNPLPEVTVKPPTRAIGTCFFDHFEPMVADGGCFD